MLTQEAVTQLYERNLQDKGSVAFNFVEHFMPFQLCDSEYEWIRIPEA